MACSTGTPISTELQNNFRSAVENRSTRFFVVRIVNDECIQAEKYEATSSLQADFDAIPNKVGDTAAFILVRIDDTGKKWITITYVPNGTKIKDRMVYSSSKATLLKCLGFQYFHDEMHANTKDELGWAAYSGTLKPIDARSSYEKEHERIIESEEAERKFRAQQRQQQISSGSGATGNTSVGGAKKGGIGGYHAVQLPFTDSAKTMLSSYASGTNNFVELAIVSTKDKIEGKSSCQTTASALSSKINKTEPRFYFFKFQGKDVFIYCCPDNSARQMRMVYSTSKGSVTSQASSMGINNVKSIEVSDASDLTEQYLREKTSVGGSRSSSVGSGSPYGRASYTSSPSSSPKNYSVTPSWANRGRNNNVRPGSGGGTRSAPTAQGAHPIYSQINANSTATRKKKIVIPPRHAY